MQKNIDSIGRYISILYRAGAMYFNKNFNIGNIGSGQYTFLLFLENNEGVTQEEMTCKLIIDKGTTAKALKKLEEEGLVKRSVDENDKRAYRVYLTADGRDIIKDIRNVLLEWNDILTSDFTEEEKKMALNLLQRMVENKKKKRLKEITNDR
ncbi:Organic hydroperoxide resistance transcriptional regulator [compost metagenome]